MREPIKRAEIEPRAVVTWKGPGLPVVLTLYGPDGEELALPLEPKRALTLAQELLTQGVQAIKWEPGAPWAPEWLKTPYPAMKGFFVPWKASMTTPRNGRRSRRSTGASTRRCPSF